jgi:class 3 adenylate cyclase
VKLRGKLVLAMMIVVGLVTGLALVATQHQVETAHRRSMESQFAAELRTFFALQQARLRVVRTRCLRAARSVRLLAALEEGDPVDVYRNALDELRDVLEPADPSDETATRATFFRLLDAGGRVLPTVDPRAGLSGAADATTLVERLQPIAALDRMGRQEVGYVALDHAGAVALYEVVVTKVVDGRTGRAAGGLVLGFAFEPTPIGAMQSALWVDGALHGATLSASARDVLGERLGAWRGGRLPIMVFDGDPHLVLVQRLNPDSVFPPALDVGFASLAPVREEQTRLRLLVLAAGALALLLAFALSAGLAHELTRPVRALLGGTREIARGNYEHRVTVRGRDELADLGSAFNEMAGDLALKDRYRQVLDVVADPKVAEQLLAGGLALGGEGRDVGVLFCDIRGFTALSERMEPTEVIALLNDHMTAMTRVVYAHGGVVDKFVGDTIMALFGAPQSTGADVLDMARCALAMVAERERLNRGAGRPLEIGIGIAAGRVVAGCMGSRERLDYTVVGARVNLAARLCAGAEAMEIVLDAETRACLGDAADVVAMGPLAVKGFSEPVRAFRLRAVRELAA